MDLALARGTFAPLLAPALLFCASALAVAPRVETGPPRPPAQFQDCVEFAPIVDQTPGAPTQPGPRATRECSPDSRLVMPLAWVSSVELLNCSWDQAVERCDRVVRHEGGASELLATPDRPVVSSLHQFTGLELASPLSRADLQIRRGVAVNRVQFTIVVEQAQWLAGLHLQSSIDNPRALQVDYTGSVTRVDGQAVSDTATLTDGRLTLPAGYDVGLYTDLPLLAGRALQGGGTALTLRVTFTHRGDAGIVRLPELTPVFRSPEHYLDPQRTIDLIGLRSQLPESEVLLVRDRLMGSSWSAPAAFKQDAAGSQAGQLAPNVLYTGLAPGESVTEVFWLVLKNAAQSPLFRLRYRDPHDGGLKLIYGGAAVQGHDEAGQHGACAANPDDYTEQYCKITLQGRSPMASVTQTIPIVFEPLHPQPGGTLAADGSALRSFGGYVAAVIVRDTDLSGSGSGVGAMRLAAGDSGRAQVAQHGDNYALRLEPDASGVPGASDLLLSWIVAPEVVGRDDMLLVTDAPGWRFRPALGSTLQATIDAGTVDLGPLPARLEVPLQVEALNPAVATRMPRVVRVAIIARDTYQDNLQAGEPNALRGAVFSSFFTVVFKNADRPAVSGARLQSVRLPTLVECVAEHKSVEGSALLASPGDAGMDLNDLVLAIESSSRSVTLPINAEAAWLDANQSAWRKKHVDLRVPLCVNPDYQALLHSSDDWQFQPRARLCRDDDCTPWQDAPPQINLRFALNRLLDCANFDSVLGGADVTAAELQQWDVDSACVSQLPDHASAAQRRQVVRDAAGRIESLVAGAIPGVVAAVPAATVIDRPLTVTSVPYEPARWRADQQGALAIASAVGEEVAASRDALATDNAGRRPAAGGAQRTAPGISCSIGAVRAPPASALPPLLRLSSRISCTLTHERETGVDGCSDGQAGEYLREMTLASVTLDLAVQFGNKASVGLATASPGFAGRASGSAGAPSARYGFSDLSMTLGATVVDRNDRRLYEIDLWNAPPGQDPARCRQAQYEGTGVSLTLNAEASLENLLDLGSGIDVRRLRQLASGPLLAADALKRVSVSAGWSENRGSEDAPLNVQFAAQGFRIEGDMSREQAYSVSRVNASFSPGSSAGFGFSHLDDETRYRMRSWLVRGAPWPLCYVYPGDEGASATCNRSQWAQQKHSHQSGSLSVTWNPASILKTVVNNVASEAGKNTNWNSVVQGLDNSSCAVGCISGSWTQLQATSFTNRQCRSENQSYEYDIGYYPGVDHGDYRMTDVEACAAGLRLGRQPFASQEWDNFARHQPEFSSYRVQRTGPVIDLVAVPECYERRTQMQLLRCQCGPIGGEASCEIEQTQAGADVNGGSSRAVIDLCDFGIGDYFAAPGTLAVDGGTRLRMRSMWRESAGEATVRETACY